MSHRIRFDYSWNSWPEIYITKAQKYQNYHGR